MRRFELVAVGIFLSTILGCEQPNKGPEAAPQPVVDTDPAASSLYAADDATLVPLDTLDEPMPAPRATSAPPPPPQDEVLNAPVGGRTYVVQKGDTLYGIARKMYGDEKKWRAIWQANQARIKDPSKLNIGTRLVLP